MRGYNFRRKAKIKEQKRRKTIYNDRGYWPAMPSKGIGEYGEEYYTEGFTGIYKGYLKRRASKAVRSADLDSLSSGAHYKRAFDLMWEWY